MAWYQVKLSYGQAKIGTWAKVRERFGHHQHRVERENQGAKDLGISSIGDRKGKLG